MPTLRSSPVPSDYVYPMRIEGRICLVCTSPDVYWFHNTDFLQGGCLSCGAFMKYIRTRYERIDEAPSDVSRGVKDDPERTLCSTCLTPPYRISDGTVPSFKGDLLSPSVLFCWRLNPA